MMKKSLFLILTVIGLSTNAYSQLGFSHEIGVITGPVAFQSDYGERSDFDTNSGNTGFGIGLIHYLNFAINPKCNCYNPETYYNDHFKLRSEISYNKTNFEHFGRWVDPSKTSVFAQQLRAMKGSTEVVDLGMQLEYFPLSIRDFTVSDGSFAPFISLGAHYSFFNADASSSLGPFGTPISTPVKYIDAFRVGSGNTWSMVSSIGTRYKLNDRSDLMLDLRWQYYFSNWVDGLSPDPVKYPENKANDWNLWLNFGYIYYLN